MEPRLCRGTDVSAAELHSSLLKNELQGSVLRVPEGGGYYHLANNLLAQLWRLIIEQVQQRITMFIKKRKERKEVQSNKITHLGHLA